MGLFSGISDWITGGRDQQAEEALNQAMGAYGSIPTPTQAELSLPQLQEYVNAGLMTPAEAQAYMQSSNAFATEDIPQTGTAAMQQALGELSSIADAGPMGTPVEQAQSAQTIQQMNNAVQGQRGSIEQAMEAKGTPATMIQAALQNQYVGQDAQQAYQNSLNQQAAAYQAAVQALSEKANVGGALQSQQNTQANTVAQAQNAMQQFNAANQQQASALNAQLKQQANLTNQTNAQNISNQNVGTANARTAYNTGQRQTAFDDAMGKAQGQANVAAKQADNYQAMGQQAAQTASSIFGGLSDLGNTALMSGALPATGAGAAGTTSAATAVGPAGLMLASKGGVVPSHDYCFHDGGICMEKGGMIPGHPKTPGNSIKNDTVPIMASPGEAVIPRTAVQMHPEEVQHLIAAGRSMPTPGSNPAHPHDVASVLEALKQIRMGAHP